MSDVSITDLIAALKVQLRGEGQPGHPGEHISVNEAQEIVDEVFADALERVTVPSESERETTEEELADFILGSFEFEDVAFAYDLAHAIAGFRLPVPVERGDLECGERREDAYDDRRRIADGRAMGFIQPDDPEAVMQLVIIESAYAGDIHRNTQYAKAALADSLSRGEAPFASHALYTLPGVLDDDVPAERAHGIAAGLAWGDRADLTAVYVDQGVSEGMLEGIMRATLLGRAIEYRDLPGVWSSRCPTCSWLSRAEGHWSLLSAQNALEKHECLGAPTDVA